jgi:hypothetical protein
MCDIRLQAYYTQWLIFEKTLLLGFTGMTLFDSFLVIISCLYYLDVTCFNLCTRFMSEKIFFCAICDSSTQPRWFLGHHFHALYMKDPLSEKEAFLIIRPKDDDRWMTI